MVKLLLLISVVAPGGGASVQAIDMGKFPSASACQVAITKTGSFKSGVLVDTKQNVQIGFVCSPIGGE